MVDTMIDDCNSALDSAYALQGDSRGIPTDMNGKPLIPAAASTICRKCNGSANIGNVGHFVRDCPSLGGHGRSFIGAKFGTADGFKENETRPKWFTDEQAKGVRRRMAIGAARKPAEKGGTYAKNQRRSLATHPSNVQYQYLSELADETLDDIIGNCTNYDQLFNVMDGGNSSQ